MISLVIKPAGIELRLTFERVPLWVARSWVFVGSMVITAFCTPSLHLQAAQFNFDLMREALIGEIEDTDLSDLPRNPARYFDQQTRFFQEDHLTAGGEKQAQLCLQNQFHANLPADLRVITDQNCQGWLDYQVDYLTRLLLLQQLRTPDLRVEDLHEELQEAKEWAKNIPGVGIALSRQMTINLPQYPLFMLKTGGFHTLPPELPGPIQALIFDQLDRGSQLALVQSEYILNEPQASAERLVISLGPHLPPYFQDRLKPLLGLVHQINIVGTEPYASGTSSGSKTSQMLEPSANSRRAFTYAQRLAPYLKNIRSITLLAAPSPMRPKTDFPDEISGEGLPLVTPLVHSKKHTLFTPIVRAAPRLEELKVWNLRLGDAHPALGDFWEALQSAPHLRKLSILGGDFLRAHPYYSQRLAECLEGHPNLAELNLDFIILPASSQLESTRNQKMVPFATMTQNIIAILRHLGRYTQIRRLSLRGNLLALWPEVLESIGESLGRTQLLELDLRDNGLGDSEKELLERGLTSGLRGRRSAAGSIQRPSILL